MKAISITIAQPCAENWNNFTPTSTGGFCSSCQQTVTDFTAMSDREIADYFSQKPSHTCGRFRAGQIKSYSLTETVKVRPGAMLFKAGLVSLLMVLISRQQSAAQELNVKYKTEILKGGTHEEKNTVSTEAFLVRGIVKSEEDKMPLPGVNILLKGTTEGTVSGADGAFQFPKKLKAGDVLVFSFIGLETKEYVIANPVADVIEMKMSLESCVMMGKVAVNEVYSAKQNVFRKVWASVKGVF
jgi:hypothetical protein